MMDANIQQKRTQPRLCTNARWMSRGCTGTHNFSMKELHKRTIVVKRQRVQQSELNL